MRSPSTLVSWNTSPRGLARPRDPGRGRGRTDVPRLGWAEQGREHQHGRGLAGTVGTDNPTIAPRATRVEPGERARLFVVAPEPIGLDGEGHARCGATRCDSDSRGAPPASRGPIDQVPVGRQPADGIGLLRGADERERLAPAPAEIDRLAGAAPAGLPHPIITAERLECRGLRPDPLQRMVADGGERQCRDVGRTVARQRAPVRHHQQIELPPAAIARLRVSSK